MKAENTGILDDRGCDAFVAKKGRIFECFWPQKNVIYFEFSLLFSPYNDIIYI